MEGRTVWKDSLEAQALGVPRACQGRGRAGLTVARRRLSSRVAVVEEAQGGTGNPSTVAVREGV